MFRRLTALGFAVALLIALPFAAAASANTDDCRRGPTEGLWGLPDGDELGTVHGGFFLQGHHQPALVLRARLAQRRPHAGVMIGELVRPNRPDVPTGLRVVGHWIVGPHGVGHFEAVVLRVRPGHPDERERVGQLVGRFADPAADNPHDPGRFVGRWRICDDRD